MSIASIGSPIAAPPPVQSARSTDPTSAPAARQASPSAGATGGAGAAAASTASRALAAAAAEAAETPSVTAREAARGDSQAIRKEAQLQAAHPPMPGKLSVLA